MKIKIPSCNEAEMQSKLTSEEPTFTSYFVSLPKLVFANQITNE